MGGVMGGISKFFKSDKASETDKTDDKINIKTVDKVSLLREKQDRDRKSKKYYFLNSCKKLPHERDFCPFLPTGYLFLYQILPLIGNALVKDWNDRDLFARNILKFIEPCDWIKPEWHENDSYYRTFYDGIEFKAHSPDGDNKSFKALTKQNAYDQWNKNISTMQMLYDNEHASLKRLYLATNEARSLLFDRIIKAEIFIKPNLFDKLDKRRKKFVKIHPIISDEWGIDDHPQDKRFVDNIDNTIQVGNCSQEIIIDNEESITVSGITIIHKTEVENLKKHLGISRAVNVTAKKMTRPPKRKRALKSVAGKACDEYMTKLAEEQKHLNRTDILIDSTPMSRDQFYKDHLLKLPQFEHLTKNRYYQSRKLAVKIHPLWGNAGNRYKNKD